MIVTGGNYTVKPTDSEWEVRVHEYVVGTSNSWVPYGSTYEKMRDTELFVTADIVVPRKWSVARITEEMDYNIKITIEGFKLKPDPYEAMIEGVTPDGKGLVIRAPEWIVEGYE